MNRSAETATTAARSRSPDRSDVRQFAIKHLAVEIESDVVFHKDGGDGIALARVLGHVGEFELRHCGIPLADRFAERIAKCRRVEPRDHFGAAAILRQVRSGAAHEDDFHESIEQFERGRLAGFDEAKQNLIPMFGGAQRQVVSANRAAVREREWDPGAGDRDVRFSRCRLALVNLGSSSARAGDEDGTSASPSPLRCQRVKFRSRQSRRRAVAGRLAGRSMKSFRCSLTARKYSGARTSAIMLRIRIADFMM